MAAGPLPPLSELLSWGTAHLIDGADYWVRFANRLESGFVDVHQRIRMSGWEGEAYDTAEGRAASDIEKATGVGDRLRGAAKVACAGASDESAAQSGLRYALEDAWDAGFDVHDDYTVKDAGTVETIEERAARQAQAEALAGNIRARAAQLVGLDQRIGAHITAALGGLAGFSFDEKPAGFAPESMFAPPPDVSLVWCVAQVTGFLCTQYFHDGSTYVYPSPTDRSGVVTQHGP
ncbi:hypothetical protein [Mycobacterium sp. 1081908.1]|uniref:hypothetical protein n=1 Tax=Mycobacterium sp. 1081908.1 TaxID=1834066 RepID=UPI0007FD4B9C|nr:hypothetical protein [Mycobacterium sp. 1081908.1]OBK48543.1 hypothetical protein A5655_03970 [Mycobacterium sp. 1081908.1]